MAEIKKQKKPRWQAGLMTLVMAVAGGGFGQPRFSREAIGDRPINDLADEIIREVCEGIDGAPKRAGVIKASAVE